MKNIILFLSVAMIIFILLGLAGSVATPFKELPDNATTTISYVDFLKLYKTSQ